MLSTNDYITDLLNLKDVIINGPVQSFDSHMIIPIELARKPHICPCCKQKTDMIHDYRLQNVKDLSSFGKAVIFLLKKRRYHCSCGHRFFEQNTFLSRFARSTNRFKSHIVAAFAQARSATNIAHEHHCSTSTALRYFDYVNYPLPQLPEVIAIDEFKGNANGEKFQCIIADPIKIGRASCRERVFRLV